MAAVEFTQVVSRGCGMDIHKEVATVRGEGIQKEPRSFGTFTSSLTELREWLVSLGITHVAMESTGGAVQPYRYSGKELVRFQGLDWLDYGTRWYDPATLRWNRVDPMAEKYHSVSPYVYCLDNPLNAIDIHGDSVVVLIAPNGANGAGHMAILIQNPDLKWELWSKKWN